MWLVEEVRRRTKGCGKSFKAVGKVISKVLDEMPDSFEIKPILMAEKEEVLGMIFEEYNEQKAMRAARKRAEKRFNEGIEKGVSKEKKQSVLRYSQLGLSAEQIAKGSDLPVEEVQKILESIGK